MISALGRCEDPACSKSSTPNHELVRLFRCSIHCDRLLCLYHLNAHNVYYEEERKQNDAVLNELQNNLTLYQTIFEQHIQEYREIVHQATTLLLHNTSSILPIDQIRPVLEKLQRAISIFQHEKVTIKNEISLDMAEFDIDSNLLKNTPPIKEETNSPNNNPVEPVRTVVVRLERINCNKEVDIRRNSEQTTGNIEDNITNELTNNEDNSHALKTRKLNDENHRSQKVPPVFAEKKKYEKPKKKTDKIIPLKRLQT